MKAVILAGGKGTRLAPYTTVLPKPLLPVGGVPILETILLQLRHYGFAEVVLACGYLSELVRAYLQQRPVLERSAISYHVEREPLGTAGALGEIAGLDETFLVMNGDILTDLDYRELLRYHRETGAGLTIAITGKKVQIELGVLALGPGDRITGYDEKPVKEYPASMGIYVYEPRVLSQIRRGEYLDFPAFVLRLIACGEKVMGYRTDAFWLDMGNRDDYERAGREFERNPDAFLFKE